MKKIFSIATFLFITNVMYAQSTSKYSCYISEGTNTLNNNRAFKPTVFRGDIVSDVNKDLYTYGTFSFNDPVLHKFTLNGKTKWSKKINSTSTPLVPVQCVISTDQQVFLINQASGAKYNFLKLDINGNIILNKTIDFYNQFDIFCSARTDDNGFIIGGSGCIGQNYFIRFDSSINVIWEKTIQNAPVGSIPKQLLTKNGNSFTAVSCSVQGKLAYYNFNKDLTTLSGFEIANLSSSSQYFDASVAFKFNDSTQIFIAGLLQNPGNKIDIALCNTNGTFVWKKTFTVQYDSSVIFTQPKIKVIATQDGGVTLITYSRASNASAPKIKTILTHIDASGNLISSKFVSISGVGTNEEYSACYDVENDSTMILLGFDTKPFLNRINDITLGYCSHSVHTPSWANATINSTNLSLTTLNGFGISGTSTITDYVTTNLNPTENYICNDTVSIATDVTNFELENSVLIYPNPASTVLTIDNRLLNSNFEISDISGKTIRKGKLVTQTIDIKDISNGMYIFNIYNRNGYILSRLKFVKN